ncbi:hypothetical protein ACIBP6_19750 [Nonomuraea terrae]|uniref:hypothetical protein n=1 Tax=Nonomuraea terrae TaxID=2530383 RepID=UPI0037AB772D
MTSRKWDCSESFGSCWPRDDVVVEATTEDEAIAVMDAALRAFAASPDIEDGRSTPQEYATQDEPIIIGANDPGSTACRMSARCAATTASRPADTASTCGREAPVASAGKQ